VRGNIRTSFEQRAAANNMTMDQFIEHGGVSAAEFDAMLDEQARQSAEIDAALEAYVREKKVKANERDYPRLLGIDPEIAKVMFKQARAAGTFDQIERAALRGKAADEVVSECRCTYHHESEAEAAERLKMLREIMAQG
jgi:FKBP-type peptidyl-prolyl cis-trans isomerase (trigger factor)